MDAKKIGTILDYQHIIDDPNGGDYGAYRAGWCIPASVTATCGSSGLWRGW